MLASAAGREQECKPGAHAYKALSVEAKAWAALIF